MTDLAHAPTSLTTAKESSDDSARSDPPLSDLVLPNLDLDTLPLEGLADAALLDLLLDVHDRGSDRESEAASLGNRLLRGASLRHLTTRSDAELVSMAHLLPADARRLAALFELSRRILAERLPRGETFLNPRQIFDYFHARLRDLKKEVFCVVLLDARHRIMGEQRISEGSLTSSIVHPREVFTPAVRESAGAVVFVHNHPSGEPTPSDDDIAVTRRLEHAAELLGIRILDHIIVGDGEYTSFKEVGLM